MNCVRKRYYSLTFEAICSLDFLEVKTIAIFLLPLYVIFLCIGIYCNPNATVMKRIFYTLLLAGFALSTQQISAQDNATASDVDKQSVTKPKKKRAVKPATNKEVLTTRQANSSKKRAVSTFNTTAVDLSKLKKPIKKVNIINNPEAKTKEEEN